jgi:hypothetical protein
VRILNSVINKLQEHLTQNFIPIKLKELLAQKRRKGFVGQYDKFCIEMNHTYSMCVE